MTDDPRLFSLDSNIYDRLAADHAAADALEAAITDGRLEPILTTHVQRDQLEHPSTPDATRGMAGCVLHTPVATAGLILDVSRLDETRLWDGNTIDAIRGNTGRANLKHSQDALILNTADAEGAVLVTEDGRLRKRGESLGLSVWSWARFRDFVLGLAASV